MTVVAFPVTPIPTCAYCHRGYSDPRGCTGEQSDLPVALIPYGRETRPLSVEPMCRDCGVPMSRLHHTGCALEECSLCGQQRLLCCNVDCDEVRAWATGVGR